MGATCIGIEITCGGIDVEGTGMKDWCVDCKCNDYRCR